ncbi:retrovirus-related pol polyprotein from transposon TNT 1-94 [Tanacetum coccineum]|uniref:Retrovirus-related pol polyprotein from transposon TNT 1-94 n=1 Tax=Tanacetum coccineum TaxID=301880 RepID=A0ABQ5EPM1_9ASTR
MLYDGNVIAKETNVISNANSEETLMLEEECRSKMLLKQSDPMVLEKKVNTKPINYAELNRLSEDFDKRFVPQQELSDEQALHPNTDQSASSLVKIEAPRELSKVSLVNTSLKNLKYHLGQFNNVVQKWITPNALTEGEWGFEHTKVVFQKEIIPFLKTLKDIFNVFDKDLLNEVTEVQIVFNQMEAAVQQYHVDKQCFEIQKKFFLIENDRLLDQIISQDIVNIVVNSSVDVNTSVKVNSSVVMNDSVNYVEMCNKCLDLEAELIKQHNMVGKDEYNKLSKCFSKLEQHCISLEIAMQLNKEIFQKNNTSMNQTEPSFDQLFNLNNLKAELQAKDTTIEKLKTNIKRLNKTSTTNSVKKDIDEIKTINIELEHRVTKLIAKNEHLKQTYKQLYDSIKPSRKCFCHNNIKNDLRKLKGKDIVDNAAQVSNSTTIAPGMYKLNPVILAPKVKNNREAHEYYLKHTIEQAAILREVVKQAKSRNPLDSASYSAYKYVKLIQELLGYVRDTCPDNHKPSKKLVVVTPINKKKTVRFAEPVISSSTSQKQLGVSKSTKSSRSKSTDNKKNDRTQQISSRTQKKNKVEDHSRIVKSSLNKKNCVEPSGSKSKSVKKTKRKEEWKPTGKVFTKIGYVWRPIRRTFTLVGNACPLTRITTTNKVPLREPIPLEVVAQESIVTKVYTRRPKVSKTNSSNSKPKIAKFVIFYIMEPGTSRGSNTSVAPSSSSVDLSTVKFGNDKVATIMGYGDYHIGNVTISRVHYVEGLGHNLFLVGSRGTNLYYLSIRDMMASSPICLLSKATKTKSWLWHRRLSHLNFGAINHLARHCLVRGLPRIKFEKDHLCSTCAMGKSKKQSHKPKSEDTNQEKLYLLHMDLCGPMRVASVNGKKYILVIMDDYSRFTWVGISHETSVMGTLQQNGVVERRNCTLVEAAHTMLIFAQDPSCLLYAPKKIAYRIYNRRTRKIIETIHVDFDELAAMAFEQLGSGPRLQCITPATPSSGLVPNPPLPAPVASPVPVEEAPAPVESTCLLSLTTVDQDVPSLKTIYEESSSSDVIPTTVHSDAPILENLSKWTKDHPLQNIIGDPSRLVSIRLQLHEQALFCYYDAVRNTKFLEKSWSLHRYW